MSTFAIIPCKERSTGIPGKNWTPLTGVSPTQRAYEVALVCGFDRVILSTDAEWIRESKDWTAIPPAAILLRPPALCMDETPMLEVVKHAMEYSRLLIARNPHWTGKDNSEQDDVFVLLQPTQPLRKPEHVRAAIALLEDSGADSVVSVVELPKTHNPEWQYLIPPHGGLVCWPDSLCHAGVSNRQELSRTYIRDGTAYCFRRSTVTTHGNIYGLNVRPLIIPPDETCPLDTEADWNEAERRLRALS